MSASAGLAKLGKALQFEGVRRDSHFEQIRDPPPFFAMLQDFRRGPPGEAPMFGLPIPLLIAVDGVAIVLAAALQTKRSDRNLGRTR
jgi:hypothetical protein